MTKDEATELIERIPYIGTANMPGSKERIEFYRKVISQRDPVMWIKVIKTGYICKNNVPQETMRVLEHNYTERAKTLLHRELAAALEIKEEDVEAFIKKHLQSIQHL